MVSETPDTPLETLKTALETPKPCPLLWKACKLGLSEQVRELLAKDVDVDEAGGEYRTTPLIVATERGHVQVVEMLLDAKADMSLKDTRGFAAIHLAVQSRHMGVVHLLLANGANPSVPTGPDLSAKQSTRFKPY
ncbi:ankyrin repeat-containing domain protein [Baffinella frigidus]|nr:ankyrin repeat-containing domain protein [Cryptophyta sp. CCMP2293]